MKRAIIILGFTAVLFTTNIISFYVGGMYI